MPTPKNIAQISEAEALHLLFLVKCGMQLDFYMGRGHGWKTSTNTPAQMVDLLRKRAQYDDDNYCYRAPHNERAEPEDHRPVNGS